MRPRGQLTAWDTTSHDAPVIQRWAPEVRGTPYNKSVVSQRSGTLPHRCVRFLRRAPRFRLTSRNATWRDGDVWRRFIAQALSSGFFAALVVYCSAYAGEAGLRSLDGESKPLFTLPDLSGKLVDLSQQHGHVVFLHFFATWCEPCREELPALRRLAERSAPDARVVAVSVGEPDLRVRRFAETITVNFPLLLDRDSTAARSWQVTSLPTTYVLDRNLRPSLVAESDFAWDALDLAKLTEQLAVRDVRLTGPTNEPRGPKSVDREE